MAGRLTAPLPFPETLGRPSGMCKYLQRDGWALLWGTSEGECLQETSSDPPHLPVWLLLGPGEPSGAGAKTGSWRTCKEAESTVLRNAKDFFSEDSGGLERDSTIHKINQSLIPPSAQETNIYTIYLYITDTP